MALDEPFIIRKLREKGFVHTIKGAKKWLTAPRLRLGYLDEVTDHPIMLNRANASPFEYSSISTGIGEGKALNCIRLFVPPSTRISMRPDGGSCFILEARLNALALLSTAIFFNADGRPIMTPTQDVVLGLFRLQRQR